MEQNWIDRLARQVATTTTRRRLARLAMGGALAGLAREADEALAACKPAKKKCRKGKECCTGKCKKGKCAPCANGQTICTGACVDLQSNTDHCGQCDFACFEGQICANGVCTTCPNCSAGCCDDATATCQAGTTDEFCGANGFYCRTCPNGQACVNQECVDKPCGQGGPCRVFVTSTTHTGNLGGIAGADTICRNLAAAANVPGANAYMAWLSDATTSPATRFHQSTGPYLSVDGVPLANNWADLTDGSLENRIKRTENNQAIAGTNVWTATLANGSADGGTIHHTCGNWTDAGLTGGTGWSDSLDSAWTDVSSGVTNCTFTFPLYCFQQP